MCPGVETAGAEPQHPGACVQAAWCALHGLALNSAESGSFMDRFLPRRLQ